MRFSLRNSRVQISFLCLRSLLVLLLRLSNTTILSTSHHDNSFKKSLRRVEYLLPEYTLVIHASTSTHFSSFDFLLLCEEIDRVSSPPSNSRSSRFFDFTLSYHLNRRRMTFLSARTRKRVLQSCHRNVVSSY